MDRIIDFSYVPENVYATPRGKVEIDRSESGARRGFPWLPVDFRIEGELKLRVRASVLMLTLWLFSCDVQN